MIESELSPLQNLLRKLEPKDSEWQEKLAQTVLDTYLEPMDDSLLKGPDGLRYLMVKVPTAKVFQGVQLRTCMDQLVTDLAGYAIQNSQGEMQYVLSHGDLLSLLLYDRLILPAKPPYDKPTPATAYQNSAAVKTAHPSEEMLPPRVRVSLRELMRIAFRIKTPKAMLIAAGDGYAWDLLFNIHPESFPDMRLFEANMARTRLFLPRHLRMRCVFQSERSFRDSGSWLDL